jgi:hypothetical protein
MNVKISQNGTVVESAETKRDRRAGSGREIIVMASQYLCSNHRMGWNWK